VIHHGNRSQIKEAVSLVDALPVNVGSSALPSTSSAD
jgi:nicotinamide mononucleotide adenylyltransferase